MSSVWGRAPKLAAALKAARKIRDEALLVQCRDVSKAEQYNGCYKKKHRHPHSPARSGKACSVRLGHDLGVRPHIAKIIKAVIFPHQRGEVGRPHRSENGRPAGHPGIATDGAKALTERWRALALELISSPNDDYSRGRAGPTLRVAREDAIRRGRQPRCACAMSRSSK